MKSSSLGEYANTLLGTDFVIGYDLLSKGSRTAAELTLDLFNEHYGIFPLFFIMVSTL